MAALPLMPPGAAEPRWYVCQGVEARGREARVAEGKRRPARSGDEEAMNRPLAGLDPRSARRCGGPDAPGSFEGARGRQCMRSSAVEPTLTAPGLRGKAQSLASAA